MNAQNTSLNNIHFREELINRFFNSKSYFYHCLKTELLNKESSQKHFDPFALETVNRLIDWLLNSKSLLQDLREISQIKGFRDFYYTFETKISDYNFKDMSREYVKDSIKNIALYSLQKWIDVCSDEDNRNRLLSYLDLKQRLRSLLMNYNGSDKFIDKKLIPQIEHKTHIDRSDTAQKDELPEEILSTQSDENLAYQKFFIDEINKMFAQLTDKMGDVFENPDNFNKIKDAFYKVNELAKFHEYTEVEQLSDSVLGLLTQIERNNTVLTANDFDLIVAVKNGILHYITHQDNLADLNLVKKKIEKRVYNISDQHSADTAFESRGTEQEADDDDNQQTEYNTYDKDKKLKKSLENEKPYSKKVGEIEAHEILKNDMLQFTLPGEDDEDLMQLIQEISKSMSVPTDKKGDAKKSVATVSPKNMGQDEVKFKKAESQLLKQRFNQEGKIYIQLILEAVKSLEENGDEVPAIEEIETAAFSLKNLAKKCDLEEISFFPELVESICINSFAAKLSFPRPLLKKIKQGALLMNKFDPENEEHESELIAILSSLKEYYTYTLKSIEKMPISQ